MTKRMGIKKVIHAVGPIYSNGKRGEPLALYMAVINSLRAADKEGLKSIAMPAVSSGIFGFPKGLCAQIFYQAIDDYVDSLSSDGGKTSEEMKEEAEEIPAKSGAETGV